MRSLSAIEFSQHVLVPVALHYRHLFQKKGNYTYKHQSGKSFKYHIQLVLFELKKLVEKSGIPLCRHFKLD